MEIDLQCLYAHWNLVSEQKTVKPRRLVPSTKIASRLYNSFIFSGPLFAPHYQPVSLYHDLPDSLFELSVDRSYKTGTNAAPWGRIRKKPGSVREVGTPPSRDLNAEIPTLSLFTTAGIA